MPDSFQIKLDRLMRLNACTAVLLVSSAALTFDNGALRAGTLEYSWSGTITPTSEGDPWNIGPAGLGFYVRGFADTAARDDYDTLAEYADFYPVSGSLTIGGEAAEFVDNGYLEFQDNLGGDIVDLITFGGRFQRGGVTQEFSTLVSLPTTTFSLSTLASPPPTFSTVLSSGQAIFISYVYWTTVSDQTLVAFANVSEPSSLPHYGIAGLILGIRRRFSRGWR